MKSSSQAVLGCLRSFLSHQRGAEGDDRTLLRRFDRTRDDDAFTALVRRHGPMVLGLAHRVTGEGQLAEDVFQAAFLMLARKVHTLRRPESLACWLHGVTFRLALRARRTRQRRRECELHVRPSHSSTPLEELTAAEFLTVLDEELQALPERSRAPLILCCLEGLTQVEAAKRLGCSAGAVRGRLERGRNQLRQRLTKRGLMLPSVMAGSLLIADAAKALPPSLLRSTLAAVKTGIDATPAATLLMEEAMRTAVFHKLKMACVVVGLLSAAGGGFGVMALHPHVTSEGEPAATSADDKPLPIPPRLDLHDDPLPPGAVMRLGTLKRRAVGARLAVTADGKSILSVRGGKYVCIWDAANGKLRTKYQLPEDTAGDSVLSKDGRLLLTGLDSGENRLKLWEARTGKALQTFAFEGAGTIWHAAFSADGKTVAAASTSDNKSRLRVWELATGKVVFQTDIREKGWARRLLFAPDGKRLLAVVSANPSYLACWDLGNGREIWRVNNYDPYALVCTPDGKLLSSVKPPVLDLATGKAIQSEKMPEIQSNFVLRLLLSPDSRTLFVSTFKKIIVWDRKQGKVVRTLPGAGAGAGERIVLWPDGKSLLTNNIGLQRWDVASGKPLYADTFNDGHAGAVSQLAWSADGRRIASDATGMRINTDGTLRLWDAATGRPLHRQGERKAMRSIGGGVMTETGDTVIDLSPDGRWLLTNALGETSLKIWQADTGEEVRTLEFPPTKRGESARQLIRARFSADGANVVALVGSDGNRVELRIGEKLSAHQIVVWDAKNGKRLSQRPIDWTQSEGSALAPDGRTVLANGILFDAATGKQTARLEGLNPQYTQLNAAFSRDGALVVGESPVYNMENKTVTISRDGVRVWEAATGKTVAHVKMKPRSERVLFHPNNRYVATNDVEGIRLWDLVTGKLALRRAMPEILPATPQLGCFASSPVFAPDGRLATGHPDGTILIWDMPLPARKPRTLATKELETLWADLASADAAKAWRAVWRMVEAPREALPFLRPRVEPYPVAAADATRKLLADLDSDSFAVRQTAAKRLHALGLQAEPALRAMLNARPSLEQRRRIEELLAVLPMESRPLAAEELRQLRAIIVLERIGSPAARRVLEEVAKGPASARRTRQALAALACLTLPSR